MDFKLYNPEHSYRTTSLPKDAATVIEAGKLVGVDGSNLAIEADATSTFIAYTPFGAPAGQEFVLVCSDKENVTLTGTADANFAVANLYTEVDVVINSGVQNIDLGASTTDVLRVIPNVVDTDLNTVGSPSNVLVTINKHLIQG